MTKLWGTMLLTSIILSGASSVHEFSMKGIDGKMVPLSGFKGRVMLVVNVASQCGYTYQYEGLQMLFERYKDQGLVITGFPANNFGAQEPGTDSEIQTFCKSKYGVTFPMFSKISVAGRDKAALYQFLTQSGGEIKWNFTKFLVDRDGKVIRRFEPEVEPMSPEVLSSVEAALKKK
jgi:glutathione peroxidase